MADTKLSALTSVATGNTSDELHMLQAGTNVRITKANLLKDYLQTVSGDTAPKLSAALDGQGNAVFDVPIQVQSHATTVTTYTLATGDEDKYQRFTSGSAVTVTVPSNAVTAFGTGTKIPGVQIGTGTVEFTVSAGSPVTLNGIGTFTAGQYSSVQLIKVSTDEWDLLGDLVT